MKKSATDLLNTHLSNQKSGTVGEAIISILMSGINDTAYIDGEQERFISQALYSLITECEREKEEQNHKARSTWLIVLPLATYINSCK